MKPGALAGSLALFQEREAGRFPKVFEDLWRAFRVRHSDSGAARQMVETLMLCRHHDPGEVARAAGEALQAGALEYRAIQVILDGKTSRTGRTDLDLEISSRLQQHDRPTPTLASYDRLIGAGR